MNQRFSPLFTADLSLPVNLLLWGFLAAYVVHVIEESLMGENFVVMVQRNFFPAYTWAKFFGFNSFLFVLTIVANALYDAFGGGWLAFPLTLAFLFATNGLWHLLYTLITRRYSPGLASSQLYWLLVYFIVRYYYLPGEIPTGQFILSASLGTLATVLMIGSLFVMRGIFVQAKPAA